MTYKVGQILFVVAPAKMKVVPVQVVEELTKRTLKGNEVSYIVKAGDGEGDRVDVKDIEGEIFTTADTVRKTLIERSTEGINRLVNNAVGVANKWYAGGFEHSGDGSVVSDIKRKGERPRDPGGKFVKPEEQQLPPPAPEPTADGGVQVELEDGTVANVKMPEVLTG